ncbi:MAG TPA: hypothetical protein DCP03_13740 [Polaromonas sp.]|nr:hypothetical protein [Polaromonas sp.]
MIDGNPNYMVAKLINDDIEGHQYLRRALMSPGTKYYTPKANSKSEDYEDGSESPLIQTAFYGDGVEALGFTKGGFNLQHYVDAMRGKYPSGQSKVQANPSKFKTEVKKKGKKGVRKNVHAMDATASPPKTVSLQILVMKDEVLLKLLQEANRCAMDAAQKELRVRITVNGKRGAKSRQMSVPVEGAVWTSFFHTMSRLRDQENDKKSKCEANAVRDAVSLTGGDPQAHFHNIIFSAAHAAGDFGLDAHGNKKLLSLDPSSLLRAQKKLDAIFLQKLASLMRENGYALQSTKDGFEIAGYTRDDIEAFSDGRTSIKDYITKHPELVEKYGSEANTVANYKTRLTKDYDIPRNERLAWWEHKAATRGLDLAELKQRVTDAKEKAGGRIIPAYIAQTPDAVEQLTKVQMQPKAARTARDAVLMAAEHLTTNKSRFSRSSAIKFAMIDAGDMHFDVDAINTAIDELLVDGTLVKTTGIDNMTTKVRIETDESIYKNFRAGVGARKPSATVELVHSAIHDFQTINGFMLTMGQREAIEECALSKNMISVIIGDAGTGKTTSMEVVKQVNDAIAHKTFGFAPTKTAVAAMLQAGIDAITSQKAMLTRNWWKKNVVKGKTSIIFDEAGLKDAAGFARIQALASEFVVHLVLVGDNKQFSPVNAGAPFYQVLQETEKLGTTVRLTEMRRAKTIALVHAHEGSRDNPMLALANLYKNSMVTAIRNPEKRIDYIASSVALLNQAEREKSLVITGLNADRKKINLAIREKLGIGGSILDREAGMAGGHLVKAFEDYGLTPTQKQLMRSYEVGSVVRATIKAPGMKNGETCRIVGANTILRTVTLQRLGGERAGEKFEFDPAGDGAKVQIGENDPMAIASGDVIKFNAEFKFSVDRADKDAWVIQNGTRAVVEFVDSEKNRMTIRNLNDGSRMEIPITESMPLTYGWVMSAHSTQGLTMAKEGKLWIHLQKNDPTLNYNAFYTTITRSTMHVECVTDCVKAADLLELGAKISKGSDVDLAVEDVKPFAFTQPNAIWNAKNADFILDTEGGTIAAQLAIAKAKFGHSKFLVSGSREYIDTVVRTADELGMNAEWHDEKTYNVSLKIAAQKSAAVEAAKAVDAAAQTAKVAQEAINTSKAPAAWRQAFDELWVRYSDLTLRGVRSGIDDTRDHDECGNSLVLAAKTGVQLTKSAIKSCLCYAKSKFGHRVLVTTGATGVYRDPVGFESDVRSFAAELQLSLKVLVSTDGGRKTAEANTNKSSIAPANELASLPIKSTGPVKLLKMPNEKASQAEKEFFGEPRRHLPTPFETPRPR